MRVRASKTKKGSKMTVINSLMIFAAGAFVSHVLHSSAPNVSSNPVSTSTDPRNYEAGSSKIVEKAADTPNSTAEKANATDLLENNTIMEVLQVPEETSHGLGTTGLSPTATVDDDNDLIFVMHVGPPKTGITSMQIFLFQKAQGRAALIQDNYKVPSFPQTSQRFNFLVGDRKMKNHAIFGDTFVPPPKGRFCPTQECQSANREYFKTFINDAAATGSNILVSSENLSGPLLDLEALSSYVVPQYKIHVVLYYRRFYDWAYSYYNQHHREIHSFKVRPERTFVQWLTDDRITSLEKEFSTAIYERYEKLPGVFNVSVVNMHEDPANFDTYERFSCNHLDQAPHLCKAAKSVTMPRTNPSKDINWISFRASISFHHSIKLSEHRDEKWNRILEKFFQMKDYPRVCLSPSIKYRLLMISLGAEMALTPESWHNSKEGLENLKSDFDKKSTSKLCHINPGNILKSQEWQDFLTKLDNE